jgi:hypothetical protein
MLDVQRRHATVFRIRLGDKGSRGEPRKLTDSIRVTSAGKDIVSAFCKVYGGDVQPWDGQFEAYLPTTELAIMVLPGNSIDQWWELYRGSVCERRCDGFTETVTGGPCQCPSDIPARMAAKGACRPMTRVSVLCPDVEVVGAGSLVTHGMVAAETLPQSIAVAEAALSRGLMVPAVLRIVEHKGRRHFVVPQIEIVGMSLNTLSTGETAVAVSAPPRPVLAEAPPLPDEVPALAAVPEPEVLAKATQGHPSARDLPPLPDEVRLPPPVPGPVDSSSDAMTDAQRKKLLAGLRGAGIVGPDERHTWASALLGREVATFAGLKKGDASTLIDALEKKVTS